jgi:hypothetical protein
LPVELADDPRMPMFADQGELFSEIDPFHDRLLLPGTGAEDGPPDPVRSRLDALPDRSTVYSSG